MSNLPCQPHYFAPVIDQIKRLRDSFTTSCDRTPATVAPGRVAPRCRTGRRQRPSGRLPISPSIGYFSFLLAAEQPLGNHIVLGDPQDLVEGRLTLDRLDDPVLEQACASPACEPLYGSFCVDSPLNVISRIWVVMVISS